MPMQFEEFSDCIKWFHPIKKRKANEQAWKVAVDDVLKYDEAGNLISTNLDIKNPNAAEALEHLPPEKLVEDILTKERRIMEIMEEVKTMLEVGKR